MKKDDLMKLSDPSFHASLGIEPCWKPQTANDKLAIFIPYYEHGQCKEILDAVCEVYGWSCDYAALGSILFCTIYINIEGDRVFKQNSGGAIELNKTTREKSSDIEKKSYYDKTTASNAFARAALSWGIGRHLKLMKPVKFFVSGNDYKSEDGKVVINKYDTEALNNYCNKSRTSVGLLYDIYRLNKQLFTENPRAVELMAELKTLLS